METEFSPQDVENGTELLDSITSSLEEMSTAVYAASNGLSSIGFTLKAFSTILEKYSKERYSLIKLITAILLDTGTYEYTMMQDSLEQVKDYGYAMIFNPDNSVTLKVVFPEYSQED
jgi:hypothetical protein